MLQYEMTPLNWAAYKGHMEMVKALLAAGAKTDAADQVRGCVWRYFGKAAGELAGSDCRARLEAMQAGVGRRRGIHGSVAGLASLEALASAG